MLVAKAHCSVVNTSQVSIKLASYSLLDKYVNHRLVEHYKWIVLRAL